MHSLEVIKALNTQHAERAAEARVAVEKAKAAMQERPTDQNIAAYAEALRNYWRF